MGHAARLNAAKRERGVVWHDCQGCGTSWPFPKGFEPTQEQIDNGYVDMREWICAVCVQRLWAALKRASEALPKEKAS